MPASSTRQLELIDYVLLACGALIIILLTVGALWNVSVRVRHMGDTTGLYLTSPPSHEIELHT